MIATQERTAARLAEDAISDALARLEDGRGPDRVLVDLNGCALPPSRLPRGWSGCACVLVRSDGWTLGCPRALYDYAKQLWINEWVAVICYANTRHRVVIRKPA